MPPDYYRGRTEIYVTFSFLLNNILLGVGLAMDAFSVSLADGLSEPNMSKKKQLGIASIFAGFQFLMPIIGWVCVHTIATYFKAFEKLIPWIGFLLLLYIGGKMLIDGIRAKEEGGASGTSFKDLIVQGIATSIDALSVGFTIADYKFGMAFWACFIINVVTFIICFVGIKAGKVFGTKISNKAQIFGGVILIGIGIEILVSGLN